MSVPAKTVVSTGVSAQSSAGSSGETKSKTLARRARVEKTTGSRKRAKGASITLTAGAGENTLSQDPEKSGIELSFAQDRTGKESQSFLQETPLLQKSESDVTLTQVSHSGSVPMTALSSQGFDRNPSSSEGLDPTPPISPLGGRPPHLA